MNASTSSSLPPVGPALRLGVLGGGQLGRMTAMAAARLGYRCMIYAPEDHAVAAAVAAGWLQAPYEDFAALARLTETLAESAVAVTFDVRS